MKPFRERNQKAVAVGSAAVIVAAVLLALNFSKLPVAPRTDRYHADLADAGQLVKGEEVTIAGVRVGTIEGLHLEGAHVRLDFDVSSGTQLGTRTALRVKILSALGQEYAQLTPAGPGRLPPGSTIPLSRTSGTQTLIGTVNDLGSEVGRIDIAQLQQALRVTADNVTATSPAQTAAVIAGIGRLSVIVADRQNQLAQLVTQAQSVTATIAAHRNQLVDLVGQSDLVLQVLQQRQADIKALLDAIAPLSQRISQVLTDKDANLGTLLANLNTVTANLAHESGSITAALPLVAAFTKYAANATGSGPFADGITPTLLIPDNIIEQCAKPGALSATPTANVNNGCSA
jgi:phospholipid/cholesterol/gamma-HCH transport system substrate-binding protein